MHGEVSEFEAKVRTSSCQQTVKLTSEALRNSNGDSADDQLLIKAVGVSKTYEGFEHMTVCPSTFGVKQGEVFGILGPDGAGKSSCFGMMSMQISKTEGSIELMGQPLESMSIA